jgi:hypothetical protein
MDGAGAGAVCVERRGTTWSTCPGSIPASVGSSSASSASSAPLSRGVPVNFQPGQRFRKMLRWVSARLARGFAEKSRSRRCSPSSCLRRSMSRCASGS